MEKAEGLPVRETSFRRDWTEGSIIRNLLSLSWPVVINQSLNVLGPVIDMIWVGKLGAAAVAGVGISSMAVMLITSARMGLSTGVRAMVARFVGEGDARGANHVAQQAFFISGSYIIVVASIGIFFAEPILVLMGLERDVIVEGAAYMRVMFVGSVAMSFRLMAEGILQGSGDTMTPMRIAVLFRLLHVILCPFLVFGWWIFPYLGVRGAALTNIISQSLGTVLGFWVLFGGHSSLRLTMRNFHFDRNMVWRIVKIGLPASVMTMERTFGHLVLTWVMVPFGTLALAGHVICQRIEMILFMPAMGLGVGSGVLVGHNLGANQPERAERSGWLASGLAECFMVACSIAILIWAEGIIHIFSSEPGVVALAGIFLRIAAAGYLTLGFYAVLSHCISGAGDTVPPMLVTALNFWLAQVPLAFLLPRVTSLGVYGVRWAMVSGMVLGSVAYIIYFRLGRWKRKKV